MFAACCKRGLPLLLVLAPVVRAELVLEDAWVRAVPPNARTTAAYFVIRNAAAEDAVLTRVRSPVAGAAEMHDWVERDGVKRMVRQMSVTVPAGGEVAFQSGGKHVMLFRLDPVPAAGSQVSLCVGTEQQEVCANADVRMP